MKKFLLILTSLLVISALVFVSCSKSDNNGCPDGYYGTGCNIPWVSRMNGVWHSTINVPPPYDNTVTIAQTSASDPKHFKILTFLEENLNGALVYRSVIPVYGTMIDSSSFKMDSVLIVPNASNGAMIYLLSGEGALTADGQTILGTRSYMILTPNSNSGGNITYDTTYTTKDFTLIK